MHIGKRELSINRRIPHHTGALPFSRAHWDNLRQHAEAMGNNVGTQKLTNPHVLDWVKNQAALCRPDGIFWCDGSEEEKRALTRTAVDAGVLIELNQQKLPGCYL